MPDWGSVKRITAYIQKINELVTPLPYVLGDSSKLKKEVHFHPDWVAMIQDNTVNILGWIQYEKVKWLQNNNPEVPGLIYKLAPMDEVVAGNYESTGNKGYFYRTASKRNAV